MDVADCQWVYDYGSNVATGLFFGAAGFATGASAAFLSGTVVMTAGTVCGIATVAIFASSEIYVATSDFTVEKDVIEAGRAAILTQGLVALQFVLLATGVITGVITLWGYFLLICVIVGTLLAGYSVYCLIDCFQPD